MYAIKMTNDVTVDVETRNVETRNVDFDRYMNGGKSKSTA